MPDVITIGEILVEVMRKERGVSFSEAADFIGPFPSGAPAIFADAVTHLGPSVGIIGSVGEDEFGTCILDRLERDGVDITQVKRSTTTSTGVAFVSYFGDGSREFIYHMGNSAAGAISEDDIDESYLSETSVLYVSGSSLAINQSMRDACYTATEIATANDLIVSLDPNLREELGSIEETREILAPIVENVDILIPTEDELRLITEIDDENAAAKELLDNGAEMVAVTKDADGSTIHTPTQSIDVPAIDVDEVDPTGAGDAFSAAIVVGYLEGMETKTLGKFANTIGGKATTVKGPMEGLPLRDEVDTVIR